MTWIGWMALGWALVSVAAIGLLSFWIGEHWAERRAQRRAGQAERAQEPATDPLGILAPRTAPLRAQRALRTDTTALPVQVQR